MEKYYRPEWTCGRYDSDHRVAIFYNLIEGLVYLFEDKSAEVIGKILSVRRNSNLDIDQVSKDLGINEDVLNEFLTDLTDKGLLTYTIPSSHEISRYRQNLINYRKRMAEKSLEQIRKTEILNTHDEVEMQYMKKCKGIFNLMIELTYNCSEKCIHCYNIGASRNNDEKENRDTVEPLTLEEYKRVIDDFCELGLVKVCLTGGDPFSNPLVWDILDYLWQKELAIDIFTNGQLLLGKVQKLASYYPRTVGISVYSGVDSVHDNITRIKGSFKRTLECIKECSRLGMPMLLKCCIMQPNVKSYYTVKSLALKYGMVPQFDLNITDSLDGDICASKYLRLNHEQMEVVLQDEDLPYFINGENVTKKKTLLNSNEWMCNAGINTFCLTPPGDLQPCCAFPMKCGNIRKEKIKDILDNPILRKWQSHKIKDTEECMTHPYCEFCQLCAGNNYNSTSNYLKSSDNNCFLAKERYNLNQKLIERTDGLNEEPLEQRLEKLEVSIPRLKREFKKG